MCMDLSRIWWDDVSDVIIASHSNQRYIESNTGKSARQGNLWHPRVRFQSFEILPEGVGDFPVLHFLPVFDFISHFYQLFLVSCLFVNSAWDHVINVSYFPFMSIKKAVPYLCVLRKGYYVIIWLIVRICVFIKDWKLIYSALFILKRKSMENWGGSWLKLYSKTHVIFLSCTSAW
jgi:hypothetical protein